MFRKRTGKRPGQNSKRKRSSDDSDDEPVAKPVAAPADTRRSTKTSFTAARAFAASGTAASLVSDTATRTIDIDGGESRAANDTQPANAGDEDDDDTGTYYKGANAYNQYVNKKVEKVTQANAGKLLAGPLYAPTNVRLTTRFDYAMDVCKDYKETGHCGFGDNCVFMHDRGDYKSGWQIELEWEKEQREKRKKALQEEQDGDAGHEQSSEESLRGSLQCLLCKNLLREPVVSACAHVVCEACALKRPAKCRVCDKATGGTWRVAKEAREKLKQLREIERKREEEIKAAIGNPLMQGVEEDDDDDDREENDDDKEENDEKEEENEKDKE